MDSDRVKAIRDGVQRMLFGHQPSAGAALHLNAIEFAANPRLDSAKGHIRTTAL